MEWFLILQIVLDIIQIKIRKAPSALMNIGGFLMGETMIENREVSENKYILKLKKVIIDFLKNDNVKIVLFGSRARGDNYISSDVDIGIIPYGKFDEKKITILKTNVENLNIPYKVEIVDFSGVSESFKKETLKEAVVWKE